LKSKESEYKELFLIEAKDSIEQLDSLFVNLERDHANGNAINSIFRITHTMKGNAMGMGFDSIAALAHTMEDVMIAIRSKQITLSTELFEVLFKANDKLGALVKALETDENVSYWGIKSRLSIFLKNELEKVGQSVPQSTSETEDATESTEEVEITDDEEDEKSDGSEISSQISFSDVIQIPVKKMDDLLNQVGQLIIERDRLMAASQNLGIRSSEFESLQRITSNLQYSIMNARMVQVGFLFNKFHRILRDAAIIESKNVNLALKGTEIEVDRNILKILSDSLIHLVRNSVSHGIESAEIRKERKKPAVGTVILDARYERDSVYISVKDDGAGIDPDKIRKKIINTGLVSAQAAKGLSDQEVLRFIFESGFSNADKVNELSGRGVGMDVVKRAVESIGGQVTIDTKLGLGTTISLLVPSSLALKGALLFEVGGQEFAIALSYMEAVVSIKKRDIYKLSGGLMARFKEEAISIVFLTDILEMHQLSEVSRQGVFHHTYDSIEDDENVFDLIVVSYADRMTGIVVDKLLLQKEIIEKSLSKPLNKIKLLSGITILGNGNVCPVIDVAVISDIIHKQTLKAQ
jgi:two-component system, chemotaxis family, sensor kinase CheA